MPPHQNHEGRNDAFRHFGLRPPGFRLFLVGLEIPITECTSPVCGGKLRPLPLLRPGLHSGRPSSVPESFLLSPDCLPEARSPCLTGPPVSPLPLSQRMISARCPLNRATPSPVAKMCLRPRGPLPVPRLASLVAPQRRIWKGKGFYGMLGATLPPTLPAPAALFPIPAKSSGSALFAGPAHPNFMRTACSRQCQKAPSSASGPAVFTA